MDYHIFYLKPLSPRETQVTNLVMLGMTNKQIADKLCITDKCVKYHMTNILRKKGCKNRNQLIVKHFTETKQIG